MSQITYADAGVNIEAGNEAVRRIKDGVHSTFSPHVIGGLGGFGAMYDLKAALQDYDHPVMVQSIDGVGTKTIVARMANNFSTLGQDLLSACANDILVLGAKTLTMLDYVANDTLNPQTIETFVKGLCVACRDNHVSLVGGETAEMPDTYLPGEHDLVGVVTGVVDKARIIDGSRIQPGDVVLGVASSGLHTNGFSLARKLMFDVGQYQIDQHIEALGQTVADALLAPHINYANPVHALLDAGVDIKGMAHITGGGLLENVPRVLPDHVDVEIQLGSWPALPLFDLLCDLGKIGTDEAHRAFNMGIGWVMVMPESEQARCEAILAEWPDFPVYRIGQVVVGKGSVSLLSAC